jgi:hypothetical protein
MCMHTDQRIHQLLQQAFDNQTYLQSLQKQQHQHDSMITISRRATMHVVCLHSSSILADGHITAAHMDY